MSSSDEVTRHISSVGTINHAISIERMETLQDSSSDANLEESGKTGITSYDNCMYTELVEKMCV